MAGGEVASPSEAGGKFNCDGPSSGDGMRANDCKEHITGLIDDRGCESDG